MIEYLEDVIELNPSEEFPLTVQQSGMFVHRTGDALMDKWQEKTALGETIDFDEAFTTDAAKKTFEAIKERSRLKFADRNQLAKQVAEIDVEEVHDDYTGGE